MTPATEALVERLKEAAQVQRWAHNDPMVSLLVEAEMEIRRLSADHISDPRTNGLHRLLCRKCKEPAPCWRGVAP